MNKELIKLDVEFDELFKKVETIPMTSEVFWQWIEIMNKRLYRLIKLRFGF